MAKLAKREKIILGVMAIAIIFAAFVYLSPTKKSPGTTENVAEKTAELNTFTAGLAGTLKEDTMKNPGTLILARAEKEWARDPFLNSRDLVRWNEVKAKKAKEESAAVAKIDFVYSGYFEVRGKRIAIINGIEYNEGEALDMKGYMLKSVSPEKVVIENRGIGAKISVPMLE
ncbi:MAG: hypothetical protein R6V76_02270 [Desulfobacterales bacterium]